LQDFSDNVFNIELRDVLFVVRFFVVYSDKQYLQYNSYLL